VARLEWSILHNKTADKNEKNQKKGVQNLSLGYSVGGLLLKPAASRLFIRKH
jgi:hypothetical protein